MYRITLGITGISVTQTTIGLVLMIVQGEAYIPVRQNQYSTAMGLYVMVGGLYSDETAKGSSGSSE